MARGLPGLGILSLSIGLVLASASARAEGWIEHRSSEGGYRLELPDYPATTVKTPKGGASASTEVMLALPEIAFLLEYADYSADMFGNRTPHQILAQLRDASGASGKLRSDRAVMVASFPGREYVVQLQNGVVLGTRTIIAGHRVYQLMTTSRNPDAHEFEIRRFFDSFNILSQ